MIKKFKAFTLSEVLITLVIIGIIAALTVPAIHQNTKEKEFHSKFKKNVSLLENALKRAQLDEGAFGDNTVIFKPSEDHVLRSYNAALKLSKYAVANDVCNCRDKECADKYNYKMKRKDSVSKDAAISGRAIVVLADGSFLFIQQNEQCEFVTQTCKKDDYGNCLEDEDGNEIMENTNYRNDCAELTLDVNGFAGPNKYGKDVFVIRIESNKISFVDWAPTGGNKANHIMTGAI